MKRRSLRRSSPPASTKRRRRRVTLANDHIGTAHPQLAIQLGLWVFANRKLVPLITPATLRRRLMSVIALGPSDASDRRLRQHLTKRNRTLLMGTRHTLLAHVTSHLALWLHGSVTTERLERLATAKRKVTTADLQQVFAERTPTHNASTNSNRLRKRKRR